MVRLDRLPHVKSATIIVNLIAAHHSERKGVSCESMMRRDSPSCNCWYKERMHLRTVESAHSPSKMPLQPEVTIHGAKLSTLARQSRLRGREGAAVGRRQFSCRTGKRDCHVVDQHALGKPNPTILAGVHGRLMTDGKLRFYNGRRWMNSLHANSFLEVELNLYAHQPNVHISSHHH